MEVNIGTEMHTYIYFGCLSIVNDVLLEKLWTVLEMRPGESIQERKDQLGFSSWLLLTGGEVCPMVAKKRSATQKSGQTLEGRGLIATMKSCVSEMALEIQICVEQLSLSSTVSSILSHWVPPVFPHAIETHVSCL